MTLRRLTRHTDNRIGIVYGVDPRPTAHSSGQHAGYTLVTVPDGAGPCIGWFADAGWEVCEPTPAPAPPDYPRTLAEAVVRGTLLDVVALRAGATPGEIEDATAYEMRGQCRDDVLSILTGSGVKLTHALHDAAGAPVQAPAGTVQATVVLPADPDHPLDPATGLDEGNFTSATSAEPAKKRR